MQIPFCCPRSWCFLWGRFSTPPLQASRPRCASRPGFAGHLSYAIALPIHGGRLCEEACQDVVADRVVLLMERRMRDAGHYRELFVRVRQLLEKLHEILQARDSVVFAAHDERRYG